MPVPLFHARSGASVTTWLLWVMALTLVFAIPLSLVPWPYVDVYRNLNEASSLGWRDTVVNAFVRDVEYRPFFALMIKSLYELVGLSLWFYKAVVLLQFAGILYLFVRILRPAGQTHPAAVFLALACVIGLPTSRVLFSFVPINHHSLTILLLLLAAALALDSRGRSMEWVFAAITLVGLLFIEFGLMIPFVLTVLFLLKAEGLTRRAVVGSWVAFGCYLVVRFTLSTQTGVPEAHGESGFGFWILSPDEIDDRFGSTPWLFWAYNVWAVLLNVLASEPEGGRYVFVKTLVERQTPLWMWFHVLSSVFTTACIGWLLWRGGAWSSKDRQVVGLAASLMLLGSGLGFLYVRDRIGLPVGLGYAMLLYLATVRLVERAPRRRLMAITAGRVLAALLAVWTLRSAEIWLVLRDTAWERHLEWTDRYDELGGPALPQTALLERLRSAALSKTPSNPSYDPAWTYSLFERQFDRIR